MRPILAILLAGALICPRAVAAQSADADLPKLLTIDEMAEVRGGFTIGGLDISLGADLRTYLGGELVMRTIVSWDDDGPNRQRFVAGSLTPAEAAGMGTGLLANGHLSLNLNGQGVFLANDGQTALLQRVDGQLQNIAFNTASGIDLRQEADITLAVSNYQAFRDAMAPAILMGGLADAISQSAIGATGR